MKVAIMQPYLFPYIGYYQLVCHADCFVFLDDVNFIKGGYIAKNVIRGIRSEPVSFFVGVEKQSQNRLINDHRFVSDCRKAVASIAFCYRNARQFHCMMPIIHDVLLSEERNVAKLASNSIKVVFEYLQKEKKFFFSSEIGNLHSLRGQDRIVDLCKRLGATEYTNAIGGVKLYERDVFARDGISLGFLRPVPSDLEFEGRSYANFSIIDALMHCPQDIFLKMLKAYEIV
jgi:hypothetical protein